MRMLSHESRPLAFLCGWGPSWYMLSKGHLRTQLVKSHPREVALLPSELAEPYYATMYPFIPTPALPSAGSHQSLLISIGLG